MVSPSLSATVQPVGSVTLTPSLDSVWDPSCVLVGEATGLGEVKGVGLGSSAMPPPVAPCPPRLPRTASAVPHPAINTTRATTPAMISIHGVRCTGVAIPAGE